MRRLLLALAFLATTVVACGDDPASPTTVFGTYTLVSVGGDPIPSVFEQTTITSGSVTINANNTFSFTETSTAETENISGTWTVSGSTYTFHPTSGVDDPNDATGTFAGTTFTLTTEDAIRVYTKN